MGKIEQSIFVLVSFVYNNKYYEGIFVYASQDIDNDQITSSAQS